MVEHWTMKKAKRLLKNIKAAIIFACVLAIFVTALGFLFWHVGMSGEAPISVSPQVKPAPPPPPPDAYL